MWEGKIGQEMMNSGNGIERRPPAPTGESLLMVDEFFPDIARDAGSHVLIEHARSFRRLGLHVDLCIIGDNGEHKQVSESFPKPHVTKCPQQFRNILAEKKYNFAYLHRLHAARFFIEACAQNSDLRIIYNIADFHAIRQMRRLATLPGKYEDLSSYLEIELCAMRFSDVVITHSKVEKEILERVGIKHAIVAPWAVRVAERTPSYENTKDVAFIGFYEHEPNIDAVNYMVSDILPLIENAGYNFKLRLVGSSMPEKMRKIKRENIEIVGKVEDLMSLLQSVRLSVAPLRFGAGIKGKVLSSLAAGTPCLMSPIAAEGLDLPQSLLSLCLGDLPTVFAERLLQMYDSPAKYAIASQLGRRYIQVRFSEDATDVALSHALDLARMRGKGVPRKIAHPSK